MAIYEARCVGKKCESTSAAADENVECPLVYPGKFGSPADIRNDGSTVHGRAVM